MSNRRITGLPAATYHASEGWSQSQLKLLPDQPELFYGRNIIKAWPFKQTDDMWLGEMLHAMLLEHKEIAEIPEDALSSNGQRRGKAWDAWKLAHEGELFLLPKDMARVKAMRDGLLAEPKCRAILEAHGDSEVSYYFADEVTGLQLRARVDKLPVFGQAKARIIADIKSTSIDVSNARQVAMKVLELGYYRQGPWYLDAVSEVDGEEPGGFGFLFIRNREPFNAAFWFLGEDEVALGRAHNRVAIDDLARRLQANDWHGSTYGKENRITLPRWAYANNAELLPAWAEFLQFQGDSET